MTDIKELIASDLPVDPVDQPSLTVEGLFPKPIGLSKLNREITQDEFDFILNLPTRSNFGNKSSVNSYILKDKRLASIRQFIEDAVDAYHNAAYQPRDNVRLRITQSWANYSEPGEFHHQHTHPNSYISGVFYPRADREKDRIYFYKADHMTLQAVPKEWNMFNSRSWWYPVGTGDIILFPSDLSHMVQVIEGEETRVSIAFNTFPIGTLGLEHELTELHLGK